MIYIAVIAAAAILLLQLTDSIPMASVGGSMTIALVYFVAALAVAIHEAWTKRRGALGWVVNIVLSFVGALVAAPVGGGRRPLLDRACRRDAGHAAGSMGRALDREPVAVVTLAG